MKKYRKEDSLDKLKVIEYNSNDIVKKYKIPEKSSSKNVVNPSSQTKKSKKSKQIKKRSVKSSNVVAVVKDSAPKVSPKTSPKSNPKTSPKSKPKSKSKVKRASPKKLSTPPSASSLNPVQDVPSVVNSKTVETPQELVSVQTPQVSTILSPQASTPVSAPVSTPVSEVQVDTKRRTKNTKK